MVWLGNRDSGQGSDGSQWMKRKHGDNIPSDMSSDIDRDFLDFESITVYCCTRLSIEDLPFPASVRVNFSIHALSFSAYLYPTGNPSLLFSESNSP